MRALNRNEFRASVLLCGPLLVVCACVLSWAQTPLGDQVVIQRNATGDASLSVPAAAGEYRRFEISSDMQSWTPLHTNVSNGNVSYVDTGAGYRERRFYRAMAVTGTVVTGDHVATNDGVITIKPIYHGTFYLHWLHANGSVTIIYSDPSSSGAPSALFTGLPKADLVLVTHRHGDHLNTATLDSLRNGTTTKIVAPQDAYTGMGTNTLGTTLKSMTTIFKTGQTLPANDSAPLTLLGVTISGIPAYNTNHTKGNCNAYVLTIGGKRIFISGDTGPTAEMNALTDIDVAFLCMNSPFTLTVADAATATRTFRPKIVYPYHFRNQDSTLSDLNLFRLTVGAEHGVEVRNRAWY
jgi:L-ascorbate metabolism protein UlaG (beta-lactamase superfamily)